MGQSQLEGELKTRGLNDKQVKSFFLVRKEGLIQQKNLMGCLILAQGSFILSISTTSHMKFYSLWTLIFLIFFSIKINDDIEARRC